MLDMFKPGRFLNLRDLTQMESTVPGMRFHTYSFHWSASTSLSCIVVFTSMLSHLQARAQTLQGVLPAKKTSVAPLLEPVYAELTFGTDRFDLQIEVSEKFSSSSKTSFLAVTSAQGRGSNSTEAFDFVNVTQVSQNLFKGAGANLGLSISRQTGLNISAGTQYVHTSPRLLFVLSPDVLLSGDHDVQNLLVVKYQPPLRKKWLLYESVYVFSDYDPVLGNQQRGFVHARTGGTFEHVTVGVGADYDWYAAPVRPRRNYGIFLARFF